MKFRIIMLFAVALFVAGSTSSAGEKFGVKVYDGARFDSSTSKTISDAMSIKAACYRTNDGVAKVVEFYKKQPGLQFMGGDKEGAMFKKKNIDITVQNPWMDMTSGKMIKDTLISIVQHEQ